MYGRSPALRALKDTKALNWRPSRLTDMNVLVDAAIERRAANSLTLEKLEEACRILDAYWQPLPTEPGLRPPSYFGDSFTIENLMPAWRM